MSGFDGKNFIGGEWRPAAGGRRFEQRNPAFLHEVTGTFADSGAADVDAAIAAAHAAFPGWRALSPLKRKAYLDRTLQAMIARRDEIAAVITRENGKALREARGEVDSAIKEMDYQIGEGVRLCGRTVPEPRAAQPAQAETHQVIQLDPRRILIVDDNVDAAEMLAVMLHGWGHDTRVAYDGQSALVSAEEFQPEIVLLDLGLPTLDGYETGRRLRETVHGRSALVVAVTGWGQEQDVARSRAAGFDRHLVKPVSPQVLRTLVENAPRRVAI